MKTKINSTVKIGKHLVEFERRTVSPSLLSERPIGKEMARLIKERNNQHR